MIAHRPHRGPANGGALWLIALRRYFVFAIPAHLAWEIAQLPLYTIWYDYPPRSIAFAVVHCTGGDAVITSIALLGALLLFGNRRWPDERYIAVAAPAVLAGVAYTIFSEWHNTEVRNSWAYSNMMPTLPGLGTGLSPLLQWFVIPIATFWWAWPRRTAQLNPAEGLR
jgi:hypothetical protein